MNQLGCVDPGNKLQSKDRPLAFWRKKAKVHALKEERGKESCLSALERERAHLRDERCGHEGKRGREGERGGERGEGEREQEQAGSFNLRVFIWFPKTGILKEVSGKNLNRIFISFSSVSFYSCGFY